MLKPWQRRELQRDISTLDKKWNMAGALDLAERLDAWSDELKPFILQSILFTLMYAKVYTDDRS